MERTEYSNEETPVHTQKISVCFVLQIRRQSFVFHKHLKRHLISVDCSSLSVFVFITIEKTGRCLIFIKQLFKIVQTT